jgi:hypothetical protein
MGAIGKAIEGVVSDVAQGVEGLAKGVGDMVEGALTLNPQEAMSGLTNAASSAMQLTPEGLEANAANQMLEGAMSPQGDQSGAQGASPLPAQALMQGNPEGNLLSRLM